MYFLLYQGEDEDQGEVQVPYDEDDDEEDNEVMKAGEVVFTVVLRR